MAGGSADGPLVILNSNTHTRNIHITRMIVDAARALLGPDAVHYATYADVVETCRGLAAPLLLVVDGQRLSLPVIRAAGRLCRATALWVFDDPYNLNDNTAHARHFDHVFTNEPAAVPHYAGGATFLPCASGPVAPEVPDESEKRFDVFFCGSAWPNRVTWLNQLLRACPDLDWRISLTYNPHLLPFPLGLPESAYLRSLAFDDMQEMAARSRITLDLNRVFGGTDSRADHISASYPGPRVFELAGRGAFQVSLNTPGLREVFAPDAVPMYETVSELACALPGWLTDPEARRAAAARARETVFETHTYRERLSRLLEVCRPAAVGAQTAPAAPASTALAVRPKLLFVVHNVRGNNAFGGLELHQEIVARHLSASHDVLFFWSYPAEGGHAMAVLDLDYTALETRFAAVPDTSMLLQSVPYEGYFSQVLQRHAVDHVHFFHFRESAPSLGLIARALGVPYTLSLHDYYMIFRNFVLADEDGTYWGERIARPNEMERETLARWPEATPGAYARRHAAFDRVLRGAEAIVHISHAARRIFETAFPATRRHPDVRVFHAPISTDNYKVFQGARTRPAAGVTPRYVALGNMAAHKGGPYLIEALRLVPDFEGEIHFHGSMNEKITAGIVERIGDRAVFHGRYAPGSLDLTGYDYSLHLSTWPETYCQTLSEAWAMGVVPIVTDIGALGERVSHMETGLKVDPRHPSALASLFDHIAKAPGSFSHLRDIDVTGLFMDPAAAAAQYGALFEEVMARRRETRRRRAEPDPAGFGAPLLNRATRSSLWLEAGGGEASEPVRPQPPRAPAWSALPPGEMAVLETLGGNIDRMDLARAGETVTPAADATRLAHGDVVHVDDTINVRGWIRLDALPETGPDLAGAVPVVALRPAAGESWMVFEAAREPRADLAEKFGETAVDWGVVGAAHIADPGLDTSGRIAVRLGLRTPDGRVYALPAEKRLTGHLSRRPGQRSA